MKGKERKEQDAPVHELLALRDGADAAVLELATVHATAVTAYLAQDWDAAIAGFRRVLQLVPDDGAATTLRARCERLQGSPPAAGWDGIYRMSEK